MTKDRMESKTICQLLHKRNKGRQIKEVIFDLLLQKTQLEILKMISDQLYCDVIQINSG